MLSSTPTDSENAGNSDLGKSAPLVAESSDPPREKVPLPARAFRQPKYSHSWSFPISCIMSKVSKYFGSKEIIPSFAMDRKVQEVGMLSKRQTAEGQPEAPNEESPELPECCAKTRNKTLDHVIDLFKVLNIIVDDQPNSEGRNSP